MTISRSIWTCAPATGFSADLKLLSSLSKQSFQIEQRELIFAPYSDDAALNEKIKRLALSATGCCPTVAGTNGKCKRIGLHLYFRTR